MKNLCRWVTKSVIVREGVRVNGDAMYRSYYSSLTKEDVEEILEAFEKLKKSDAETRLKFDIEIGLRDEDGNITERYKDLFPGKGNCTPRP